MFDLGNVLVEWDPARLFTPECIHEIDFFTWNTELDRGANFAETVAAVRGQYPHWSVALDAFRDRWPDILGPVDAAVVAIVDELRAAGIGLYVLSNSSADTLPRSPAVVALLDLFDGVLVSGEVGLLKPDPAIYRLAAERFGLDASLTWFIDDSQTNVDAATSIGWNSIHFTDAAALRAALVAAGLL